MSKPLTITFRAKVERVLNMDGTLAYEFVRVPKLERRHCDAAAFRACSKGWPSYFNSDLFPACLEKFRRENFKSNELRMGAIPTFVSVDRSGFLAEVTIEVPHV